MSLMNTKEIIDEMGISRATLYRLIEEGLPYTEMSTRKKLYDPDQVREFIANRRNEVKKDLIVGKKYTNDEIVKIFHCSSMGNMRKSNTKNTLVLISFHDNVDYPYEDYWRDNILYYTGMGQTGDQDIHSVQNKTLAESRNNGVTVYLFEMYNDQLYMYRGIVQLIADPFQENEKDLENNMRKVWKFPLKLVSENDYLDGGLLEQKSADDERVVLKMRQREVFSKAREIDRIVSEVTTTTKTYMRSPIIARYAKDRARGVCELCGQRAPFEVGGIPYLETHHLQTVSEGGRDSINNIAALCPNCHRRMHELRNPEDLRCLKKTVADHNWWAAAEEREYGEINTRRLLVCPYCGEVNRIDIEDYTETSKGERGRLLYELQSVGVECEFCSKEFILKGIVEFDEAGNLETEAIETKEVN